MCSYFFIGPDEVLSVRLTIVPWLIKFVHSRVASRDKVRSFSCRFLVDKVRSFSCRFRYVNKEQLRLQYLDDENTFVHLSEDAIALWLRCFDAPFMWRMLFLNE